MKKRLILTGFPCSKESWQRLFPHEDNCKQSIIPLRLILRNNKADFRSLARSASEFILKENPDSLILHDFAVTIGLLGLLRARKRNPKISPKIILFNGALRNFDIFEATHPVKIQFSSLSYAKKIISKSGGSFDKELEPLYPAIKALYRQVILASLADILRSKFKKKHSLNLNLGAEALVIISENDPFIPKKSVLSLCSDIQNSKSILFNYKHFPYSGTAAERKKLLEIVQKFEFQE